MRRLFPENECFPASPVQNKPDLYLDPINSCLQVARPIGKKIRKAEDINFPIHTRWKKSRVPLFRAQWCVRLHKGHWSIVLKVFSASAWWYRISGAFSWSASRKLLICFFFLKRDASVLETIQFNPNRIFIFSFITPSIRQLTHTLLFTNILSP